MNGANRFFFVGSAPHPAADGPGAERDSRTNKICTRDVHVFQHGYPFLFSLIGDHHISGQAVCVSESAAELRFRHTKFGPTFPPIRRRIMSGHCRWNLNARVSPFAESPPKNLALLLHSIALH